MYEMMSKEIFIVEVREYFCSSWIEESLRNLDMSLGDVKKPAEFLLLWLVFTESQDEKCLLTYN